jgi:hypothetical protein
MLNIAARRAALVAAVFGVVLATGACGTHPTAQVGEPVILAAPGPAASAPPPVVVNTQPVQEPAPEPDSSGATPIDPALLANAAAGVEPNTTLGAVVFDRTAGAELLSVNADRQFRSASLVKLLIAIDALNRGASARERDSLARMLSLSDDDIASSFWVKGGRPEIVTRTVALLGLTGTEPPESPGKWGEVRVTAHDMLLVYQYVMDQLPAADHTLVVDALAQAPKFAADDYDQHFGIPDGLNLQWAIKQGWGNNSEAMVLHSTGLVGQNWRYVVILLTEHPLGSGWKTCSSSVTAAAGALNGLLPGA